MKRYVVLGVNENPKYIYYLPLVCWAWRRFGWEPFVFYNRNHIAISKADCLRYMLPIPSIFKTETMAQVSRLYGACVLDGYLMTSDVDMLPLSDYWDADSDDVTCYGRDLTDYHYPICYIGASSELWRKFMRIDGQDYYLHILRDMRQQKNMWTLDQDIVTKNLLDYGIENINHVNRGTDQRTGYPIGRVDRSNWTLNHKTFIDAHLPHDVLTNEKSFHNVMQLLHTVWPKEDWKWFINYTKEFKKIC